MPRERYEPRNGDRVMRGPLKGSIMRCKKQGGGYYFRVKWDNGIWDWPSVVLAESAGAYRRRCGECFIDFLTDHANSRVCPNCVRWELCSGRPDYDREAGEDAAARRAKWVHEHRVDDGSPF